MEVNEVQLTLIEILCATVNELDHNDSIKEKITSESLQDIYRLAKMHDLAHMVYDFVYRNNVEINQEFQQRLHR